MERVYWGPFSRVDSSRVCCYNELPPANTGGNLEEALVLAWMNQNQKKNLFKNPIENDRDFRDSSQPIDRKNDEG